MNKIQEVVHKFRSGGTDKKDGGGGGGSSRVAAASSSVTSGGIPTISSGSLHESRSDSSASTKWYVDPPHLSGFTPQSTGKAELSSLPIITPSGLQQTMLAALGQSDPLSGYLGSVSGPGDGSDRPPPTSPEKKLNKTQPKGTIEYKVAKNDTLEKIAAHFDVTPSELKKLNRMSSRMVFENQILYIPDPDYVPSDPPTPEAVSPPQSPVDARPKIDIPIVKMADKPPSKVPGHVMKIPSPPASVSTLTNREAPLPHMLSEDEARQLDEECYERFIKVCAQYISEGFEKIAGTLLVTPNAIMFDPDVLDEKVIRDGPDQYGVVVYMDTIISAALYHDLSAMRYHLRTNSQKEPSKKPEVFHGDTRGRSASTSSILTSKSLALTSGDATMAVAPSKSMTGLPPFSQDKTDGQRLSGLSPFFDVSKTSSSDAETVKNEKDAGKVGSGEYAPDAIQIVGNVPLTDSGITKTIDFGVVAGETNTDDVGTTPVTFELESPSSGGNTDDATSPSQGNGDSVFTTQPKQGKDNENEEKKEEEEDRLQDEEEISALLAGGRRDSLKFAAEGERATAIFYPKLAEKEGEEKGEEINKDGGQSVDDDLVQKCADKLVAEILNSVVQTSGSDVQLANVVSDGKSGVEKEKDFEKNEETGRGDEEKAVMDGEKKTGEEGEGEKADGEKREGGKGEEKKEEGVVVETQNGRKEGEEMRIGSIVYLPVEESHDGEMIIRNANEVFNTSEASETSNASTSSEKTKPPPLSSLGTDTVDSSDSISPRARTASGSFSPLRSSAQHLSNFVNYATGFFRGSNDDRANVKDIHDIPVVRDGSSETDRRKKKNNSMSTEIQAKNAVRLEERPELFRQVSDLIPPHEDVHNQPAIYLHLRVDEIECDRRVITSTPGEANKHQSTKPHYWFSVPRSKADNLYAFFVQWRPELYGDEDIDAEDRGFVVVENTDVDEETASLPFVDDYFGQFGSAFKKDWEIISREEARRRESVAADPESSMPELSHESTIMTPQHIVELAEHLPARTIGYKWTLVYSTNLHGFSLKRLYREVGHVDSPILLVLRDTEDTVFGAFLSDPPKLSDHFFGTGQCQLWTFKDKFRLFGWSGENAFFIKGDENSMSVGASQGVYGLWLDGDLYHGRSRQCTTFNNIVLSAHEDFCISALEAWAFLSD